MKVQHLAFRGELPILDARLLPEQNAQRARNLYLRHGTLKAERSPGTVSGLPPLIDPQTLYRYPKGNDGAGFWLAWGSPVDVVKSPLANDDWSRLYWTGDGPPKMGGIDIITSGSAPYPTTSYRLGIPAPGAPPVPSAPGNRVAEGEFPVTALEAAYVVTLVSQYGEEGPPSPASAAILRWDMVDDAPEGGEVEVGLPGVPSGNHDIVTKRIYRVESGGLYQFVGEVSASTGSYTDSVPSESLGRVLPSTEWDMPDARLVGLTVLPNGILAGFFDNTLCFSEAYLPHAWPVSYQLAFPDDIVAIGATSAGLVVATTGQPYLVTGSSPEAMAQIRLDVDQPCIAGRSLVDMGEYVLYASPEGLVAAAGNDARVISAEMIGKAQWQALGPETIHAYRHDGRYLAFYAGGCFVFTPGEGFEFFDIDAQGGYYDIADDTLYLIQDGEIAAWGQGQPMTYTWRSRLHEFPPGAAGFSCAKVVARDYPVTLRLIADGEIMHEQAVEDAQLFRLPAGYTLARNWEVELEGQHEVHSVQVATSPAELT